MDQGGVSREHSPSPDVAAKPAFLARCTRKPPPLRATRLCGRRGPDGAPSREGRVVTQPAAIGFRVKSGWAVAVLVAGPATAPIVLDRRVVELSDPRIPATRQPYHAATGVEQRDRKKVQRLAAIVRRCTRRSVGLLLREYRAAGFRLRGAALVVGSVGDPARITNPHILAHASEGWLFRTALETAALRCALPCTTIPERALFPQAAKSLRRSASDIKRKVTALGRLRGGTWRAEEKAAAVAAWLVLKSPMPTRS